MRMTSGGQRTHLVKKCSVSNTRFFNAVTFLYSVVVCKSQNSLRSKQYLWIHNQISSTGTPELFCLGEALPFALTHIIREFRGSDLPYLNVFGWWEEARGNKCRHRKNMPTTPRKATSSWIKPTTYLLCGDGANGAKWTCARGEVCFLLCGAPSRDLHKRHSRRKKVPSRRPSLGVDWILVQRPSVCELSALLKERSAEPEQPATSGSLLCFLKSLQQSLLLFQSKTHW